MRAWSRVWWAVWAAACGTEPTVECTALDVAACAAEAACRVLDATPVEVLTTGGTAGEPCFSHGAAAEPVGCRPADGDCPAVELYATPADDPASVWYIPHGCLPTGFDEVEPEATCL